MPTKRISLGGSLIRRVGNLGDATPINKDQKFINCFPQFVNEKGGFYCVKRTGFSGRYYVPFDGVVTHGAMNWTGSSKASPVFAFTNTTTLRIAQVDLPVVAKIGDDITGVMDALFEVSLGPAVRFSETKITNLPNLVVMARKNADHVHHAWFIAENGAAWTEITSANFVPNINLGTVTGSVSAATGVLTTTVSFSGTNLPVGTRVAGNGSPTYLIITAPLIVSAGIGTYQTNYTGAAVTSRVMTAFNNWLVGNMVHMDGYAFVMDKNGRIYNSDLNTLTTWASTSFLESQVYPDNGVGLARIKDLVIAISSSSIEFFRNSGNATGSVLTRIASAAKRVGGRPEYIFNLDTYETIRVVNDDVYFIGTSPDSSATGVFRIRGGDVTRISNQMIDNAITFPYFWGFAGVIQMYQMNHLILTTSAIVAAEESYCYCIETGNWWIFKADYASQRPISCASGGTFSSSYLNFTSILMGGSASASFSDNGSTYTMTVQTETMDFGTDDLKEFRSLRLIADTQTVPGNLTVSFSNDDFVSFSTPKNINMTLQQKKLEAGLGWGRQRAFKLEETVNRPCRIKFMDVTWDVSE